MACMPCQTSGPDLRLEVTARCRACHRFRGDASFMAVAFDGLSALTQLTRLATRRGSGKQLDLLCGQLAALTGLRELDAPLVLQTKGPTLRFSIT